MHAHALSACPPCTADPGTALAAQHSMQSPGAIHVPWCTCQILLLLSKVPEKLCMRMHGAATCDGKKCASASLSGLGEEGSAVQAAHTEACRTAYWHAVMCADLLECVDHPVHAVWQVLIWTEHWGNAAPVQDHERLQQLLLGGIGPWIVLQRASQGQATYQETQSHGHPFCDAAGGLRLNAADRSSHQTGLISQEAT